MSLERQQLGRYRLLRIIGSGGMGEVYLAQDPSINRQVAIKAIRIDVAAYPVTEDSKESARLFQREAKAIATLDHPGILPLYDYGEQNMNGAMFTYMVMPYREEGSLANWMQKRGPALLSLQIVEQIVQQAASALQYAHDHQVVHQDVKPSNFLIRSSKDGPHHPDLLLTDFGIAKLSTFTSRASQSIRGTPTYMAPEQWEGHPTAATDQYALAVMVYELLTGRSPFRGSPMQMMYAHVNTPPQPPSLWNPRVSAPIDAVVLRALAKRPEERFPSIIAFAFAFRRALRGIDPSISIGVSNTDLGPFFKTPGTPTVDLYERAFMRDDMAALGDREKATVAMNSVPTLEANDDRISTPFDPRMPFNRDGTKPPVAPSYAASPTKLPVASEVGDAPYRSEPAINVRSRNLSGGSVIMLVMLAVLLVGGSAGIFFYAGGRHTAPGPNASVTANPQANLSMTATALADATLSASNSTATATATKATATPTRTVAPSGQNPYAPYTGSLVLNDPLSNNSNGHNWQQFSDSATGNSCQFVKGAYHLVEMPHFAGACFAEATDFNNFTYQVQMMFVKLGQSFDGGGIAIRSSGGSYYYFEIYESGRYEFNACIANDCNHALAKDLTQAIPSFRIGLNQPNTIAIVANGNKFDLYVNNQHVVGPVSDPNSASSHGMIGVYGQSTDTPTDVVYSDVKVWA